MKKLFYAFIVGAILCLFSCKKDEPTPAPLFVGKWNVHTQYLNVQTGEPKPEWNWNSNWATLRHTGCTGTSPANKPTFHSTQRKKSGIARPQVSGLCSPPSIS